MRIISISNLKGGQAKTTTAVNLAAGLVHHGRRVLVIDCDAQGQVSKSLGVAPALGLAEFVADGAPEAIYQARPGLYILAGGPALAGLGRTISRTDFRSEEVLGNALAQLDGRFDYILLDTAPGYTPTLINALWYANEVLAPVTLQTMALQGLIAFVDRLKQIRQYHDVRLSYVLPVMLDRRYGATGELMEELQTNYGMALCDPIRTDARAAESPAWGQHIFEFSPRSNAALDYERLTRKVIDHE